MVGEIDVSGTWNAGRGAIKTMVSFDFVEEINNQATLLQPISRYMHFGVDLKDLEREADEPGITTLIGSRAVYIQPPAVEQAEASGTETPVLETVSGGDTLVECRQSVSKYRLSSRSRRKIILQGDCTQGNIFQQVSSDRLRRGLSQYPAQEIIALEDSVMPGSI